MCIKLPYRRIFIHHDFPLLVYKTMQYRHQHTECCLMYFILIRVVQAVNGSYSAIVTQCTGMCSKLVSTPVHSNTENFLILAIFHRITPIRYSVCHLFYHSIAVMGIHTASYTRDGAALYSFGK